MRESIRPTRARPAALLSIGGGCLSRLVAIFDRRTRRAVQSGMRRQRAAAAAMPRRCTKVLAGCLRAARAARPLRSRWAVGSLEASSSRHRLRGRCRGAGGYAVTSVDGCGELRVTFAFETARGVQAAVPCRLWHQGDRVVTDCAHECRYGCENGPFYVLLRTLYGL